MFMKKVVFLSSMSFLLLVFSVLSAQNSLISQTDTIFYGDDIDTDIYLTVNSDSDFSVIIKSKKALTILGNGNTGVGTDNPEYELDVCGSIRASEEIIVEANEWCDYVFEETYELESFDQRITKILNQKHLPYLPSENEIYQNGIPINETITGLLRNVEEMYLYIQDLEKRIDILEEENQQLKAKVQ